MLIKIKKPTDICPSEITDEKIFKQRRRIIQAAGLGVGALVSSPAAALFGDDKKAESVSQGKKFAKVVKSPLSTDIKPNSYEAISSYNNFYEFATDKQSPALLAYTLKTDPWSVTVEGECARPGTYNLEDILKPHALEERIYRFRCVEAWSMVVPWVGFPLGDLIKRFEPTSRAKYVVFETLFDPAQMPGQRRRVLDWPYVEGLRMDEAMNPLAIMAVGLYGAEMPKQNGAPMRLIVPWKYGFKSIKSIVKIRFLEQKPRTSWAVSAPSEYGFYANVNPAVDHPRWSQARERKLGASFFAAKVPTLPFNGYEEQVAHLYKGMNLRKFY